MARSDKNTRLHSNLLEKYNVSLSPDGVLKGDLKNVHFDEKVTLGYRDEGPDAWADNHNFSGPAWLWSTDSREWEYWRNGVILTGYYNLNAYIVNIKDDGVHVVECVAEPY